MDIARRFECILLFRFIEMYRPARACGAHQRARHLCRQQAARGQSNTSTMLNLGGPGWFADVFGIRVKLDADKKLLASEGSDNLMVRRVQPRDCRRRISADATGRSVLCADAAVAPPGSGSPGVPPQLVLCYTFDATHSPRRLLTAQQCAVPCTHTLRALPPLLPPRVPHSMSHALSNHTLPSPLCSCLIQQSPLLEL